MAIAVCIATVAAQRLIAKYHSLTAARAHLQGHRIVVESPIAEVVATAPGETIAVSYELKNVSSDAVSVHGAETSCSCVTTSSIPVSIAGGQSARLDFAIQTSSNASAESRDIFMELYTNPPEPPIKLKAVVRY